MTARREVPGVPGTELRRVEELPAELEGGERFGPHASARPGVLLLDVPQVARYLVRDGSTIDYMLLPGADEGAVELFLNGAARGALLHQRGDLPLHGASMVPPGRDFAVVLCGHSGAGKSTLAVELSRRGWTLIADDTTRVSWDGAALAWPGTETVKLWQDGCEAFGIDTSKLRRVRDELEKFYITMPIATRPAPLAQVIELSTGDGPGGPVVKAVDRMRILSEHTFRPRQIRPLGRLAEHLQIVSRVARSCRFAILPGARRQPVAILATMVEEAVRCPDRCS